MKKFILILVYGVAISLISISAYAATCVSNSTCGVAAHSDCNNVPFSSVNGVVFLKSPLNGKSTNPLCQLCISLQDDYALGSVYTAAPLSIITGANDATLSSVCSAVPSALPDTFISDYSNLCASRGGTILSNQQTGLIVCYFGTVSP